MSLTLAVFLAFLQVSAPAPRKGLSTMITGVERWFAGMKDFSADFVQIELDSLNRKTQDSGHLYLMRPRMIRAEYKTPEESLFVSEGKTVFLYVPADRQVNREAVGDAIDDRIPLMFLVGRSNLSAEFHRFEDVTVSSKPSTPGLQVLRMFPKRKTDLTELMMEVDPANYHVRRLSFTHSDGRRSEFIFSNIRTNTGLNRTLFEFKIPPGVQLVDGIGN